MRERKSLRACEREIMNHSLQKPFKNQSYLSESLPSPAFLSHYQNIKTFVSRSKLKPFGIPAWAAKMTINLIV